MTTNHQPPTADRQPPTANRQPLTANRQLWNILIELQTLRISQRIAVLHLLAMDDLLDRYFNFLPVDGIRYIRRLQYKCRDMPGAAIYPDIGLDLFYQFFS